MKSAQIPEEYIKTVHNLYKDKNANYGWYWGKGTAEEIINACKELANKRNFDLIGATSEGIRILYIQCIKQSIWW